MGRWCGREASGPGFSLVLGGKTLQSYKVMFCVWMGLSGSISNTGHFGRAKCPMFLELLGIEEEKCSMFSIAVGASLTSAA